MKFNLERKIPEQTLFIQISLNPVNLVFFYETKQLGLSDKDSRINILKHNIHMQSW